MSRKSGLLIDDTNGISNQRGSRNCDQEACLISQKVLSICGTAPLTGQAASGMVGTDSLRLDWGWAGTAPPPSQGLPTQLELPVASDRSMYPPELPPKNETRPDQARFIVRPAELIWPGQRWRKRRDSNPRCLAARSLSRSSQHRSGAVTKFVTAGRRSGSGVTRTVVNGPE